MRSGMMRCGLVLSLSLQAKIIELRETNKFRTLIFLSTLSARVLKSAGKYPYLAPSEKTFALLPAASQ